MNAFDIVLCVGVVLLVAYGLWKGLVRILVGVASIVVAFFVASRFDRDLAASLRWLGGSPEVLRFVAYLLLFAGVLLLGAALGWLLRKILEVGMLGWADRLAGGAIGLLAGFLVAALLVLPLVAYLPRGKAVLENSRLAPYVAVVADMASALAPGDLTKRYREHMDALRRTWRGESRGIVGTIEDGRFERWA